MRERVVVTGGGGFIGSNLVDALVDNGKEVTVVDNFATGFAQFLPGNSVEIVRHDIATDPVVRLTGLFDGASTVFHLAANADVRFGWNHPRVDFEQNVFATLNVLEACESAGVADIVFSSTGSVYGEADVFPTPERAGFPIQTSLYAASKVSAEAFIEAHAEAGRIRATIFRFVSVLGPRYSHGHVFDFVKQLRTTPERLKILGDGKQRKSYMHVDDCVRALLSLRPERNVEIFNLGSDGYCTVSQSASWIARRLGVKPEFEFTGGNRGWIGDSPFILLDVAKAGAAGWRAKREIQESVEDTVDWLLANDWIFDER